MFARNRAVTDLQGAQHLCALLVYAIISKKSIVFYQKVKNRHSQREWQCVNRIKDVFPNGKEEFAFGSHDLSRVLRHTKAKNKE